MTENEGSLTQWLQKLHSQSEQERNDAARVVVEASRSWLLSEIEKRLGRQFAQRLDPEDLLQDTLASFFRRNPTMTSRDECFAYLLEVAENKTKNAKRAHRTAKRDVTREVEAARSNDASSASGESILEAGRKPTPKTDEELRRRYVTKVDNAEAEVGSADSFFIDGTVELLVYNESPEKAAELNELFVCLQEHDAANNDYLCQIVRHLSKGLGTAEIAKELDLSTRTVERKRIIIVSILNLAKNVRVMVEGKGEDGRQFLVGNNTTARSLLKRLGLSDYTLARQINNERSKVFKAEDRLLSWVVEGEVIVAYKPIP